MIDGLVADLEGKIALHRANVEVCLNSPSSMEELAHEVKQIAEYQATLDSARSIKKDQQVL